MPSFRQRRLVCATLFVVLSLYSFPATTTAETGDGWISLFDGVSLNGWKASENSDTWQVADGCLLANGPRSHLFYTGEVGDADFRNFELEAEIYTEPHTNSGIFVHTEYQDSGWPGKGYEIQVNNTYRGHGKYRELKNTGSLYAVRNIYKSAVQDKQWFRMRVRIVGNRIQVWVDDVLTVDYVEPTEINRGKSRSGRVLSHGTVALQGHDPGSCVKLRSVKIRLLSDDADSMANPRPSDEGYGAKVEWMDRFGADYIPVIDFHIHLRGGMTVEKAIDRQAVTGINSGVLKNIGQGWPIEADDQLREFLDSVTGKPVFVGLQVNDRDWMDKHSADLLGRLDFVLGDTMIMPMPNDDSEPVKLWMPDLYKIDDPEAWMDRYVQHNLRVLAEPITILANPTYLPPPVEDMYEQLWTEKRMQQIIEAAVKNNVALEINAKSGLPSDRFIRIAKSMGAKFSFGSNNFDDRPIEMTRCLEAIDRYGLKKSDMYVPEQEN